MHEAAHVRRGKTGEELTRDVDRRANTNRPCVIRTRSVSPSRSSVTRNAGLPVPTS